MRRKYILLLSILFVGLTLSAQISIGGMPPSFGGVDSNARIKMTVVPEVQLAEPDMEKIKQEDAENDQKPNVPWRFGIAREVNLGLENAGTWDTLVDGSRIWRLKLSSSGAISINLNYDLFFMPVGAEMFVYNSRKEVLGAFTSINNKADSLFATMPISGDEIVVEYYEPSDKIGQGKLHIHQLVHGYRSFKRGNKAFNSSGYCNVNINCPEAEKWQDEKRAVARITTNSNTTLCTGTLLNNVRQDGTPYFLTAAHCGNVSNSIFVFDYESPVCQPSFNDTNTYSIVGGTLRAFESVFSDFQLVELSLTPPDSFNVFYAGWSAKNDVPINTTVIHHPKGDVKKFSVDIDSAYSSGYYDATGPEDHWRVSNWEIGTTEPGSSGSAAFNEEHKVVGQLHGGDAGCGNNNSDWFGKFSYSWANNPNPSKQLKHWLDPDTTGMMEINGFDPDTPQFALDAELLFIGNFPGYSCDSTVDPFIVIRNQGDDTLKNIKIIYSLGNSVSDSISWNGSLSNLQTATINLGNISFLSGTHEFVARIQEVNGMQDQNVSNDTIRKKYRFNSTPTEVYFTLKTDDYGSETTWEIKDSADGDILYKGGPYAEITGGQIYKDTLCLYDSCFNFKIYDAIGDGFNDPSGTYGNGYYLITNSVGDTLIFNDNFTGRTFNENFCLQVSGIDETKDKELIFEIYPNPIVNAQFSFRSEKELSHLTLFNSQGKIVAEWNKDELRTDYISLNNKLASGMYLFVAGVNDGGFLQEKVIVQ